MLDKKIIYFMAVVEEGSFSAAARKLFLSQPTLSQQITLLEEELGIVLFDRSGYKPTLTLRGHAFYDGCINMKQLESETIKRVNSIDSHTIRVGFNGANANRPLLSGIKHAKLDLPKLDVAFKKGEPDELIHLLENDKIDLSFGLESDYRHMKGIQYTCLYDYTMSLICSKEFPIDHDKPVSMKDVANLPFEFLSASFGKNYFKEFKESYKADSVKLNIIKYADTYDELMFDLIMGGAVTISSKFVMNDPDLISIPILDTHHTNRYVVAWNQDKGDKPYADFLESLNKYFKAL